MCFLTVGRNTQDGFPRPIAPSLSIIFLQNAGIVVINLTPHHRVVIKFMCLYITGMTPAQAYRHHLLKLDLSDDLYNQANKSTNPSPKSVEYMWTVWRQSEHGGLNTPSMFEAIRNYAEENPELILNVNHENDQFYVVLITPFMMRAHRQLKEAGEVVFVDATSCVDQLNTAVIPFLCAGPAGAVPLAVVFTSSQDEATLTKGN